MEVLATFNPITDPVKLIPVPTGKYDFFLFFLTGTTAAAQALLATDDVGTISLRINNENIVQSSFSGLFFATQRLGGAPAQVTPVAGATELSCAVLSTPDQQSLPNCWFAEQDGVMTLQWNSGANLIAELTTSPLMEVYGVYSEAVPFFVWQQSELVKSIPVGGPTPLDLPQLFNVTDMFVRPATPANMVRMTCKRGNRVFADGSYGALTAQSNIRDRVELGQVPGVADTTAATPDFVHLTPANPYNISTIVGPQVNSTVQAQTAAFNLSILYCAARFLGNRIGSEKSKQEAAFVSKLKALPKADAANVLMAVYTQAGRSPSEAYQAARQYGFVN